MRLEIDEPQRSYDSGPQRARVWTESWVAREMFCLNCGAPRLTQLAANSPVADFICPTCTDQYEVKSKKGSTFGPRVVDGAYHAKIKRLESDTNPHLMLLNYDLAERQVRSVCVVPRHFFVRDIIQKRKPLAATAKRANWVGSNILLREVPDAGRIFVLRNGIPEPKDDVLAKWKQTLFLRRQGIEGRGWLLDVMKAVDLIGESEFTLGDVYAQEDRLSAIYPNNNNVRAKIRQQLQVLRDNGYLEFTGGGHYRLRPAT
jgi:type II restriction enzyme